MNQLKRPLTIELFEWGTYAFLLLSLITSLTDPAGLIATILFGWVYVILISLTFIIARKKSKIARNIYCVILGLGILVVVYGTLIISSNTYSDPLKVTDYLTSFFQLAFCITSIFLLLSRETNIWLDGEVKNQSTSINSEIAKISTTKIEFFLLIYIFCISIYFQFRQTTSVIRMFSDDSIPVGPYLFGNMVGWATIAIFTGFLITKRRILLIALFIENLILTIQFMTKGWILKTVALQAISVTWFFDFSNYKSQEWGIWFFNVVHHSLITLLLLYLMLKKKK